jgi:hypothetical protein
MTKRHLQIVSSGSDMPSQARTGQQLAVASQPGLPWLKNRGIAKGGKRIFIGSCMIAFSVLGAVYGTEPPDHLVNSLIALSFLSMILYPLGSKLIQKLRWFLQHMGA